jgi:hypothetical protein
MRPLLTKRQLCQIQPIIKKTQNPKKKKKNTYSYVSHTKLTLSIPQGVGTGSAVTVTVDAQPSSYAAGVPVLHACVRVWLESAAFALHGCRGFLTIIVLRYQ